VSEDTQVSQFRSIRVGIPHHLRKLSGVEASEVRVEVEGDADGRVTVGMILDGLERRHPELRGTIRDHATGARRAYLRYFACGRDISHDSQDEALPADVAEGREPLIVMGAISGG
jgi:sulfur-carrier protein